MNIHNSILLLRIQNGSLWKKKYEKSDLNKHENKTLETCLTVSVEEIRVGKLSQVSFSS